MISARQFCREPGYPVTVFLTYSFDPLFFERIPLDDLNVGGTCRILVLGDASEISEAMKRCADQVFYLGRRYTLAEAKSSNLFHPKMILRFSPEGGRVWIGSGNLTYTGWGGNHELATAWSVGPGSDDNGAWVSGILRSVATTTVSESFRAQIEHVHASTPWLGAAENSAEPSPVLLGMPNHPLAPQLASRWQGRRFKSLKLYTGSTDVEGAFLRWAHTTFGIEKAIICLTPPFASFDAKQLAKLPLDVRFVERDPKRRVHAKLFWFSGPDGDAAVMGSANCSAAAWLANHSNGNVELITVYDTADKAAFASILADFDGKQRMPKDVLTTPVKPEQLLGNETGGEAYRITSLRLRASERTIEAVIEPAPESDAFTLVFEAKKSLFRLKMTRSGVGYTGRLADDMSLGAETVFATAEIPLSSGTFVTVPRWFDNERAIENAARDRQVDPNHNVFSGRGFAGASEQRIMEAIHAISSSLLDFETPELSALSSEGAGQKDQKEKNAADEPAGPVDPSELTYRLSDLAVKNENYASNQGGLHGISLRGVMKLLFANEDEPEIDLSQERLTAKEPEKAEVNGDPEDDLDDDQPPGPPAPRSDAEAMTALRQQIDSFLFSLTKPQFAERCPPAILAQAIVFPILLGIKGSEESWFSDEALASIAGRVVQTMFSKPYGRDKPRGLFRQVQARYATGEKRAEFLKSVGDGAVYTVLLAALASPEARSIGALIQQADALSKVLVCDDLFAASHMDQRSNLSTNVLIRDAKFAINERAPALVHAMTKLTTCLQQWDRNNPGRAGRSTTHKAGSVLWMSQGWQVTPRLPAETYCGGVNLDKISSNEPEIQAAIDALWQAMRLGRKPDDVPTEEEDAKKAVAPAS